jgi:hypothetical protein
MRFPVLFCFNLSMSWTSSSTNATNEREQGTIDSLMRRGLDRIDEVPLDEASMR